MKRILLSAAALILSCGVASAQPAGGAKIDTGTGGSGCCNGSQLIANINAGVVISAPLTGATLTIPVNQNNTIVNPAGTIATLTLSLPQCAAPGVAGTLYTNSLLPTVAVDGTELRFFYTQIVTSLTVSALGSSSVVGASAAAAIGVGHTYHCHGATTTWYQY
jgi:hypothetical protein